MLQDRKLIDQVRQIMKLYEELQLQGMRNKEISAALEMYPSAFSNFINKVLKKIIELDQKEAVKPDAIRKLFEGVNNISELKTRQRMGRYIERLQMLKSNPEQLIHQKNKHKKEEVPQDIMKMLEGIYSCYYLSTFGYRIKKEPLLIMRKSFDDNYIVRKGNKTGPSRYEGLGHVPNDHIFSIQLQECDTLIRDNFVAHFQLPPFYSSAMDMLKGFSISMSNSFMPISRKVILQRVSKEIDEEIYNEIETAFYEEGEGDNNPIISYLRSNPCYMEYVPIPHPTYKQEDLAREQKITEIVAS
ncbi:MAG: hypothetical protein AAFR87_05740 [Bacteroidota bacterium]